MDRDTLVPIGLLISVVLASVAGTWSLANAINSFDVRLAKIEDSVSRIDRNAEDEWTRRHMQAWLDLFAAQNPTITVPKTRS